MQDTARVHHVSVRMQAVSRTPSPPAKGRGSPETGAFFSLYVPEGSGQAHNYSHAMPTLVSTKIRSPKPLV